MKKYFLIAKNTWDEMLTYRVSFFMWRLRTILQLLTIYFLWFSILPQNKSLLGYTQSTMLTYVLGISLIGSIVLSSRSYIVGEEINSGNLLNFLLKPINYFKYWFSKDIGDKSMNIVFSIIELTILFIILKPPFFFQTNLAYISLFFFSVVLSVILYFFFNLLLGFIGFWNPEVWAPRFIFIILLNFFAGAIFPLDILPGKIYLFLKLLPFPYLLYFPLKIYLGKLNFVEIFTGLTISFVWVILIYILVKFIWAKGLKAYTAYGR